MKIKIFIHSILIMSCYCKSIEDPVARHDLHQCATYLCPEIYNEIIEYLRSGCVDDFD